MLALIFGVILWGNDRNDLQTPTFAWTCEKQHMWARFSQANNFSFERHLQEHLHGNTCERQEIRHLSAWRAMCFSSTSEGWADFWALESPSPERIYGVQKQVVFIIHVIFHINCCIGLTAGVLFVSWHNYCYCVFSQYVHEIVPVVVNNTLGVMWLEWEGQRRIFISLTLTTVYILALSSLLFHKNPQSPWME